MKNEMAKSSPYSGQKGNQKARPRPASSKPSKHSKGGMRSSQKRGDWESSSKQFLKNTKSRKDELYDESLSIKRTVGTLKAENIKLRNKVVQGERELNQKNKEIKHLLNQLHEISKDEGLRTKKSGSRMTGNLKREIFDTQKENKMLREGLEALKKSLKVATTQELNAEIEEYSKECARLREEMPTLLAGGARAHNLALSLS